MEGNRRARITIDGIPCERWFAGGVTELTEVLAQGLEAVGGLAEGDIVVVTQKVVSRAEGRMVELAEVRPSGLATGYAGQAGKDARVVELALAEAARVVRMVPRALITQTRHGFVCANSGVDQSNLPPGTAALLPEDADRSAERIRRRLGQRFGVEPVVIISDSFGRSWRKGQVNVAIGLAGAAGLVDYRGRQDRYGRELHASVLAVADEVAAAAELVMNKLDGVPAARVRGYRMPVGGGGARALVRPLEEDLFL